MFYTFDYAVTLSFNFHFHNFKYILFLIICMCVPVCEYTHMHAGAHRARRGHKIMWSLNSDGCEMPGEGAWTSGRVPSKSRKMALNF